MSRFPSWVSRLDSVQRRLYDCGARFQLLEAAGSFEPQFEDFFWVRRREIKKADQKSRFTQCKSHLDADAVILSTSKEVDSLALSLALEIAYTAESQNVRARFFDLGAPRVIHVIRRELEEGEADIAVGYNVPINSSDDRLEVARDFACLPVGFRVLVSTGEPRLLASRLGFDRFSAVFHQSSVFEAHGRAIVKRRTGRRQER